PYRSRALEELRGEGASFRIFISDQHGWPGLVVVSALMGFDLPPDFSCRKPRRVHVGIAVTDAQRAQKRRKVIRVESLIRCTGIERDDIRCRRGTGDGAGGGLRAVRLLRSGGASFRSAA